MDKLRDIQASLLHDIYSGSSTSAIYLDKKKPYASRLTIFSNNTFYGLSDALSTTYPVTKQIVGSDFFSTIVRFYIKEHPMMSGNRHLFGQELPKFLKDFSYARHLPYLSDVAALEWSSFRATLAPDHQSTGAEELAHCLQSKSDLTLLTHPSLSVLQLNYNAVDIWQQHHTTVDNPLLLLERQHSVAVWRSQDNIIHMRPISSCFKFLLDQCSRHIPFVVAMSELEHRIEDMTALQKEFGEALTYGMFYHNKEG